MFGERVAETCEACDLQGASAEAPRNKDKLHRCNDHRRKEKEICY